MKAVYLEQVGKPLIVTEVPEPKLRPSGVIVRVESVPVLSYMRQALSGELNYLIPVPFIPAARHIGVEHLTALTRLAIPYGGLLKAGLRAGQTIMIGGATGNIGAGAILVSLAMGAATVIALGREPKVLDELEAIDPKRVISIALRGDTVENDTARIKNVSPSIDAYFDMTGRAPNPDPIMAALGALGHGGTAVFMGGVQATLPIPYSQVMLNEITIRGNFMYPRQAPHELMSMVLADTLDLTRIKISSFALDDIEKAIDHAGKSKGLCLTVVRPQLA